MGIKLKAGRQAPIVAYVDISLDQLVGKFIADGDLIQLGALTSTVALATAIKLPVGAVVVGGSATVEQAFNSTSTDVITIGDATTADRYVASTSVRTAGAILPFVPTGFIHTASEPALKITWTSGGGTPTTGRIRLAISYYVVADIVTKTVNVGYAALTSGVAYDTGLTLPVNSVVLSGSIAINTAFNSATSDVIVAGDVTTPNRYVASTNIHTGAATPIAFVPTDFVDTATESSIKVTWTGVGAAPSAGSLAISVSYYVLQTLPAIMLPANAVVLSGAVTVQTALNSGTSDALVVGDSASPARYKSSFSIASTGHTPLVATGYVNTAETAITVQWNRQGTTAPTAGQMRLHVKYQVEGREQFTQD